MALTKFKVLQSPVNNGVTYLPEKAILLSAWTEGETGLPVVAFMMKYEDWVEEFPEEANRGVHADDVEPSGEDKKEGVSDVE